MSSSNVQHHASRGGIVVGTAVVTVALATMAVALRLYTRKYIVRQVYWEDWTILMSLVSRVSCVAMSIADNRLDMFLRYSDCVDCWYVSGRCYSVRLRRVQLTRCRGSLRSRTAGRVPDVGLACEFLPRKLHISCPVFMYRLVSCLYGSSLWERISNSSQSVLGLLLTYQFSLTLTKVSLLMSYVRLFDQRQGRVRIASKLAITYVFIFWLYGLLSTMLGSADHFDITGTTRLMDLAHLSLLSPPRTQ